MFGQLNLVSKDAMSKAFSPKSSVHEVWYVVGTFKKY